MNYKAPIFWCIMLATYNFLYWFLDSTKSHYFIVSHIYIVAAFYFSSKHFEQKAKE